MSVVVNATRQAVLGRGRSMGTSAPLLKTMLYDMHVDMGGKIVPFAGYELPVQYDGKGVLKEHMHCRSPGKASIFDVGHMGQIKWTGADRAKFLERVAPRPPGKPSEYSPARAREVRVAVLPP